MTELEINFNEVLLILLASGLLYAVLSSGKRPLARNLFLVLCIVPALFLAVEGATEILTADELYMIRDVTGFSQLQSHQWALGSHHTSTAVTGNVVNVVRTLLDTNELQAKILAKSVHWFLGMACLAGIFWTASQRWIPKNLFSEYFLIYFYGALLLPTNIISMKVANYDMLAMLLGLWGITCCFVGWEGVKQANLRQPRDIAKLDKRQQSLFSEVFRPDGGFALFGILLTTLAAQEKQIAAPLLNLAIVLSVLMRLRRRGRIDWWLPLQIGICVFVVLVVLLLTHGIVAIWRPAELPVFDLGAALRPLLSHFDIVLQTIGISQPSLMAECGLALGTVSLAPLLIWRLRVAKDEIAAAIRLAFPLLFIAALIVGVVAYYKVKAYLHPIYPIPNGNFIPEAEINGEIVHFLGRTRIEHIIKKTAMAYTTFAMTIPSAVALVAILVLASLKWRTKPRGNGLFPAFQSMGVLSSAMPLLYVLTDTPVGARYLDIWIFTPVLLLGILACRLLELLERPRLRMLASATFCLLLFCEILPFRPVIGAFRPWWASGSVLKMEPGKLTLVWPGWGEEAMIAGRHLRKMARAGDLPSASFRLFTVYPGDWLQSDQTIVTDWLRLAPYLSFTENDYYVLNRAAAMTGEFHFLTDKKPIWTLEFRGVPQAWLYRGSDLETVR
jgi:hypothetical protein